MNSTLKQALSAALLSLYGVELNPELRAAPPKQGDFAWSATQTARELGLDPTQMAQQAADVLRADALVLKAEATGPYVNLWSARLFEDAIAAACQDAFWHAAESHRVMVEYMSPNTNKPLHLGHVRNGVLGTAVANVLKAAGHTVITANLVNDRGIHICKSMAAYLARGNGVTPESAGIKGDHFVGDYYVRFQRIHNEQVQLLVAAGVSKGDAEEQAPIMAEAQQLLTKWEKSDPDVIALWKRMNEWVYRGFQTTYDRYGFRFDTMYYESELYMLGKDIVEAGISRGVFIRRPDGSVAYPLPVAEFGLNPDGKERATTLLRADGTSLYTTQDIGVAVRKADEWQLDRSIYVVACEQDHHFESLFSMLKALDYPWADRCYHLSYGMVELPEGRMKSREGNVVDADDLADEMQRLAADVIREKSGTELDEDELMRRANVIGLAAIKFYMLGFGPTKRIKFDPAKSLSFEGDTGPYCLYTYARIRTLLEKAGGLPSLTSFQKIGSEEERELARAVAELPDVILRAAAKYNPTPLAKHLTALGRSFNSFYNTHPILTCEDAVLRDERLVLIHAVGESMKKGLALLGIETLERM